MNGGFAVGIIRKITSPSFKIDYICQQIEAHYVLRSQTYLLLW